LLKSIHKPATLKKFAGQTIGIDAYGWLHRGTVACSIELATGKPTTKYVDFAMSRVRMLLDFGVTPYLVFDGDAIPSKAGTNAERRKKREESLATGLELYRAGRVSQAHQELQKAAGVTPIMARQLIDELRRNNIQYVVAPYEADAQLAYLEQKGIINGVLSEDSDLLVFGVKRLLTKLNQYGECIEIERADFANCKELSLAGWTDTMFRRMAILSGCDYLTNIPKMGLKTSYRYVRKFKDTERLLRMVALEGFLVPIGYLELFNNAELTFMHHRVFCPLQQRLVFLNELAPGTREEDMPFLGANVESDIAIGVACGDLNPKTKEPLHVQMTNTTSRPPLKESRRQTLAAPSDLKSSKSIDTFFKKPYRQPLAELDVNSLTPLNSQQRLYEAHRNASWESRMVSSAPQLRRADTALTSARTPAHTSDRRVWLAKAGQISTYQPPKRQRLCSEFEISPDNEVEQSLFFISKNQMDGPSPLARRGVSKKKTKKGGFDVFSDDEISEEAWLELAKVQELASPEGTVQYPKIGVEEDSIGRGPSQEGDSPQAILQSSPIRPNIGEAVSPGPTRSFDTVITNDEDATQGCISALRDDDGVEQFEDLLEYHIREQNKKLRESFVCQSPERRKLALESVTWPKLHVSPKRGLSPRSTFVAQSPEKQTIALKSLSPLHNAQEDENPQSSSIKLISNFAYQAPTYQTATLQSFSRGQSHTDKVEVAKAAITQKTAGMATPPTVRTPTSSLQRISRNALDRKPLVAPKAPAPVHNTEDHDFGNIITAGEDHSQHHETWASKGSEDFIVPESDEEEYVDTPEKMEKCRKINLTAFNFSGQ
jgi:exonuclease 1